MKQFSFIRVSASVTMLLLAQSVFATYYDSGITNRPFDFFTDAANGWTQFADDDGSICYGCGGQRFDTEYLFYKYNETTAGNRTLSIGLQTGFDVWDGQRNSYYGGDLALSFDGVNRDASGKILSSAEYEYAVDFGLKSKIYYDRDGDGYQDLISNAQTEVYPGVFKDTGVDQAGLYKVTQWNNDVDILHPDSSPFAMDEGDLLQSISNWSSHKMYDSYGNPIAAPASVEDNSFGKGFSDGVNNSGPDLSYFRVVTFDLSHIVGLSDTFTVDAHWTMSCGNDAINGQFVVAGGGPTPDPIPEPATFLLMGIGSLGLLGGSRRFRRRRA